MNDQPTFTFEEELQRFPASVVTEFKKAQESAHKHLSDDEFEAWAHEGIAIAQHSFRSWEAASDYFKATPEIVSKLPFPQVQAWARWGRSLSGDSPIISSAFFRGTAEALTHLEAEDLFQWADLGRGLYRGTWKSSSLCSTYFEVTPKLLGSLNLSELRELVGLIDTLSQKSYDLANECLVASDDVFAQVGHPDRKSFLSLGSMLAKNNWRDVKPYMENGARILVLLEGSQRSRFLTLAEKVATGQGVNVVSFLTDGANALGDINPTNHGQVLSMAEELSSASPTAVGDFLKNAPQVLARIEENQLSSWFEEGLEILRGNEDGGLAFFRLESSRGEKAIESLSNGIQLDGVKEILQMYCRALAGENVELQPTDELKERGIGWTSSDHASTEGNHVFLPNFVERYESKEENFGWFKVLATHQAAHLEFDSFRFQFDRPSTLFWETDQRQVLAKGQAQGQPLSDLERYFDLFPDRQLASDIFMLVEDGRLDSRVKREYRGLSAMYTKVQSHAIAGRPDIRTLPLREALMEILVRLSLEDESEIPIPTELSEHIKAIASLVKSVQRTSATVEDTSEATIRIYDIVNAVPNIANPPEEYEDQSLGEMGDGESEDAQQPQPMQIGTSGTGESPEGEQEYSSPQEVDFRGEFKPELAQMLSNLREQASKSQTEMEVSGMSQDDLRQMLEKSVEVEVSDVQEGDLAEATGNFVENLINEVQKQQAKMRPSNQFPHITEDDQPLDNREAQTFLYDEWDFRANDYKPRWCCVRERRMDEGTQEFFDRTLKNHSILASQIKRQFEMLAPEMLSKIKHLPDGEEYDFDAVVESIIQKMAGDTPTDKVYWRRNKTQRDVAVVFLLDMSASTAEAIDEGRRQFDTWDFPDDPRDYMAWLRTRREEMTRRTYKRIIDIEKESTTLLIKAMEAIGDSYGIYGFSGYGRENVEFYVIKGIDETFGDHVKRRIDKITPMHATRMGPAIRHATTKLERQDARTKILFLISDGRPQDRGYSREGVEKEYAVHDTRMALNEARRKRITPFCLTVDRAGHDYLKTMMSDMGYEVLADIQSLPKRLPLLYRQLTV